MNNFFTLNTGPGSFIPCSFMRFIQDSSFSILAFCNWLFQRIVCVQEFFSRSNSNYYFKFCCRMSFIFSFKCAMLSAQKLLFDSAIVCAVAICLSFYSTRFFSCYTSSASLLLFSIYSPSKTACSAVKFRSTIQSRCLSEESCRRSLSCLSSVSYLYLIYVASCYISSINLTSIKKYILIICE